jgi:hypothetical protein
MEGGQRLSKEELLRLLVLADRYSMHGFMEECVDALMPFDGFDGALAFFRAVLDSLLWTEALREATEAAGDALAEALGPVETLWRPGGVYYRTDVGWSHVLDERVVDGPAPACHGGAAAEREAGAQVRERHLFLGPVVDAKATGEGGGAAVHVQSPA